MITITVNGKQISIDEDEIKSLRQQIEEYKRENEMLLAYANTLSATNIIRGICPSCKKYVLLHGYVCFGCGYDSSVDREE